ncbi:Molybdopterin synthase catalytic subunit, partial [Galemys pyrenaicus]
DIFSSTSPKRSTLAQNLRFKPSAPKRETRGENSGAELILRMPSAGGSAHHIAPAPSLAPAPPPPRWGFSARDPGRDGAAVPGKGGRRRCVSFFALSLHSPRLSRPDPLKPPCSGPATATPAVEVLYFAKSAEITGIRSETISVPQEIKALQLWNEIESRHPGLADVKNQVIFAVRQEYVELGDQLLLLRSGDEIAIIPPIIMNEVDETPKDIIKFTAEKLSVDEVSQLVISPLCGAISLFVGTTRNNFEGKKVISLEYEAYLPMAENEVRKICSDMRQKWPVKHIAVFHRLGLVPVSEASIIIAVSSAHRAASLEAVSYAIDTLKAKVPIWK